MISESRDKNLRWRLGLKGCLAVDSRGKLGGLALFWDENIRVDLSAIDDRYIDVSVLEDPLSDPWRATFVYGEPRVEDRHRMWEILFTSMVCCWTPFNLHGVYNKVIRCRHIYSFLWLMVCQKICRMRHLMEPSRGLKLADEPQRLRSYYLQMIVCFSSELL
jgi:hypothetical protein